MYYLRDLKHTTFFFFNNLCFIISIISEKNESFTCKTPGYKF